MGRCIIVLGVPRSGTSAVAGCLHQMGVDMGRGHLQKGNRWNPKGYYEDLRWQKINKAITGSRYGHNAPETISDELAGKYWALAEECSPKPLWGMKDPRLCFTLKFILPYLGDDVRLVGIYRKPMASANSLRIHSEKEYKGRLRMTLDEAMALRDEWAQAMSWQVSHWRGPLLALQYEALLATPAYWVARLGRFAFEGTGILPDMRAGRAFIDRGLQHHG